LNMLFRDRRAHAYTCQLMETEARMSREAWVRTTDASDLVHGEVISLRTTMLGQMSEIRELQAADRRRQTMILELLRIDHRRSTEILELRTALQGQTVGHEAAYDLSWKTLMKMMTDKYCPRNKIRKLEMELWELKVKGTDLASYTCAAENQVKFATCTLHSVALTWWNTHVLTVGHEAAYGLSWKMLMKMMTDKYCPRNKIRKLEMELWELKVKGTDLASYTQRFQKLALLCGRMFSEESDKIKKYVGGLLDMIHGSVVASKPKTMQEAIEIATELMDKKICTFAERQKLGCYECGVQGHFKRECPKLKNNNNHGNQSGRNNASARVYAVGRAGTDPDANVVTGRPPTYFSILSASSENILPYNKASSWKRWFPDLVSRTIFVRHHLHKRFPRHAVSGFMTNGLDVGVSPCQSNRVKSACSKLDLVFSSAVADVKDRLYSFTPLGKTSNPFGAFERASRAAKAAVTP
nr:reverse transcriptase domain-containing protein [Tanacetum cinerariifolium]